MPRGQPKIVIDLSVDVNGILEVTAKEESTGKSNNIKIVNDKGRLSKEQIEEMVKAAEKYKEEDAKLKEIIENMFATYNAGKYIDVEHSMAKYIPKDRLVELDVVGLQGNIAPNGMMIID